MKHGRESFPQAGFIAVALEAVIELRKLQSLPNAPAYCACCILSVANGLNSEGLTALVQLRKTQMTVCSRLGSDSGPQIRYRCVLEVLEPRTGDTSSLGYWARLVRRF